ncbi:hypothetical protein [Aquimarina aggregata]|uniref:hypothetical protein n=1 Tax=Aquimarina aggregata TaxID=1642818 RepID=UPI00248FEABD|nr:hypothetical protein [Aquimarina aggregata]
MKIKRHIMVHNSLPEGTGALAINSGTVYHKQHKAALVHYLDEEFTPEYLDHAYVNKRDWRELTAEELECLKPDESCNDVNTVYLGEIPKPLQACFKELQLQESESRDEVFSNFEKNPELTKQATQLLHEFLLPLSNDKKFHFHCIGVNYPNVELVAANTTMLPNGFKQADKKFLGLHNDGTQSMTIDTAHEFGNRISINLGKDTRYLLFVNLPIKEVYAMLKEKLNTSELALVNISNIPEYFFKHFPDYPVIRVEQKPYQYYIAATDNCFHDGSTLGSRYLDVCIVYFGSFQY